MFLPRGDTTLSGLDPWETLGIAPGASKTEIRRAYRRLARRYHPDLNPDDPEAAERFKAVQSAYEVLTERLSRREQRSQASPAGDEPPRYPISADEDPFLGILASYIRRRRGGSE